MELSEFISLSISEIINGIEKARIVAADRGVIVSPNKMVTMDSSKMMVFDDSKGEPRFGIPVCMVDFEIAITEIQTSENKVGLGVAFSILNGGASKSKGDESNNYSKVKFSIPLTYPEYIEK